MSLSMQQKLCYNYDSTEIEIEHNCTNLVISIVIRITYKIIQISKSIHTMSLILIYATLIYIMEKLML